MGRRGYPAEFRRKVLDLVESGRSVADAARDLGISTETVYAWRRQDRIDQGLAPGLTNTEKTGLAAANKRIAKLKAELTIHRRASELLGKVVPQQTVRGDRGDGCRGPSGPGRVRSRGPVATPRRGEEGPDGKVPGHSTYGSSIRVRFFSSPPVVQTTPACR
ncbi:transposase [Nocardiopsis sp. FIRDI 009]|uniref:transposase n=1 Tax=Nocardiopsis sp. FIRDI 009 TaxID=714197 RepID=UPI0035120A4C